MADEVTVADMYYQISTPLWHVRTVRRPQHNFHMSRQASRVLSLWPTSHGTAHTICNPKVCNELGFSVLSLQELDKLDAVAAKPSIQDEMAQKFSRDGWTDAEGYPTSSADGSVDFTQPEAKKVGTHMLRKVLGVAAGGSAGGDFVTAGI